MTTVAIPAAPRSSVRVAITGAAGGFGRTLLPHLRRCQDLRPALLCDRDLRALDELCRLAGIPPEDTARCASVAEAEAAVAAGKIALTASAENLPAAAYDVVVEATGRPAVGYEVARAALDAARPVVLVTKETQAVAGGDLAARAAASGVQMVPVEGDQPAALADLVRWARECGLDVLAAGKAGEHDVVVDGDVVRYAGRTLPAGPLRQAWEPGADLAASLSARAEALRALPLRSAADVCEITVAANLLGMPPDTEELHYPPLRLPELPDAYAEHGRGGVRRGVGVLDVLTLVRRPDEASLAGGVFVVAEIPDLPTAEVLRAKGHLVSRDGRRLAVCRPHHLMGLEAVRAIRAVAAGGSLPAEGPGRGGEATMYGRAAVPLAPGSELRVAGHHHEIPGVTPLVSTEPPAGAVPFYLLDGARLTMPVAPGEPLLAGRLDLPDSALVRACGPARPLGPPARGAASERVTRDEGAPA